jgi:hypothetical protein
MTPRKPTIDDLDDVDDQDGVLEQEAAERRDLKLNVRRADDVGLGDTPPTDDDDQETESLR